MKVPENPFSSAAGLRKHTRKFLMYFLKLFSFEKDMINTIGLFYSFLTSSQISYLSILSILQLQIFLIEKRQISRRSHQPPPLL